MMPRIQLWNPDTCGCRGLWQRIDDDGTVTMISAAEAIRVQAQRYDEHVAKLQVHGLTPQDRERRTAAWTARVNTARRAKRLQDEAIPPELLGGPRAPEAFAAVVPPFEICRFHFEMGFPEDDQDERDENPLDPVSSSALRGMVRGENLAKNYAVTAAAEALGIPLDDGPGLEGIAWSMAAPADGVRAVRIELPMPMRGTARGLVEQRVGWPVEFVDSIAVAAAEDAAKGP